MLTKKDISFNNQTLTSDQNSDLESDTNHQRIENNNEEVSSYYQKLRAHIIETYTNGDKQKAINLLWEELQQPYLPLSIEQDFYDLYNAYSLAVREEAHQIDWDKITRNEIFDRILNHSTGAIDLYFVNLYLTHLSQTQGYQEINTDNTLHLDETDFKFFQFLLTHPYIVNMEKYNFLMELKNAGVDHDFNFVNNHLDPDKKFVINPKTLALPEQIDCLEKVAKWFEDQDQKRPDILSYEIQLLSLVYVYLFPIMSDIKDASHIQNAIHSYVYGIMDGTPYDRQDPIIQIIESELARIDEIDQNPYAF